MNAKDIIGKCIYCGDPIYGFQATAHVGCAKIAGMKEVKEWSKEPCPHGVTKHTKQYAKRDCPECWQAFLKGLEGDKK